MSGQYAYSAALVRVAAWRRVPRSGLGAWVGRGLGALLHPHGLVGEAGPAAWVRGQSGLAPLDASGVGDMMMGVEGATGHSGECCTGWVSVGSTRNSTLLAHPMDVSGVEGMTNMSHSASAFNQDWSAWDVGHASSMHMLFCDIRRRVATPSTPLRHELAPLGRRRRRRRRRWRRRRCWWCRIYSVVVRWVWWRGWCGCGPHLVAILH